LVASGIGAPGISRTPSSAALNRINASLDQVESNCVRGLLYVEYVSASSMNASLFCDSLSLSLIVQDLADSSDTHSIMHILKCRDVF
jgi:hypothetical protein